MFVNEGLLLKPKSHDEIINDLAKLSQETLNNKLLYAAWDGDTLNVKMLLTAGANTNTKSNSGSTPLMNASDGGHKEIVQMLLDAGADVNAKDNGDWTALINASNIDHKDIINLLKKYGAK